MENKMGLIYPEDYESLQYALLGSEPRHDQVKKSWLFPDISLTFPTIFDENGEAVIDPSRFYITSGEAVIKTERLVKEIDIKLTKNYSLFVNEQLSDLKEEITEFLILLRNTRGDSKYLEITKCEDGTFNGNICARKDPKKKST